MIRKSIRDAELRVWTVPHWNMECFDLYVDGFGARQMLSHATLVNISPDRRPAAISFIKSAMRRQIESRVRLQDWLDGKLAAQTLGISPPLLGKRGQKLRPSRRGAKAHMRRAAVAKAILRAPCETDAYDWDGKNEQTRKVAGCGDVRGRIA